MNAFLGIIGHVNKHVLNQEFNCYICLIGTWLCYKHVHVEMSWVAFYVTS